MPREILSTVPHTLHFSEYQERPLGPRFIRARVEYAAPKHGTEMHGWRSDPNVVPTDYDAETLCFIEQPPEKRGAPGVFRPGNMWVGRVTEVGGEVTEFKVGDRVAGYGNLKETQTVEVGVPNTAGPGIINDILLMPETMSWQAALCYDPCQFALGGVRDSILRLGDTCLVTGLGAIGLMAAQLAKLQGARLVIVSDPIEKRRAIALENGADCAIDPTAQDAGLEVKRLTGNRGADVVIETSGSYPGLQTALRGVAYGGRIAVVGWFNVCKGYFNLGMEAHMNNATLFFSRVCSEPNPDYPRWSWSRINETCWQLLSGGKLRCDNIIDPVVPFDAAPETYLDVVDANPAKSVKMGVVFDR